MIGGLAGPVVLIFEMWHMAVSRTGIVGYHWRGCFVRCCSVRLGGDAGIAFGKSEKLSEAE